MTPGDPPDPSADAVTRAVERMLAVLPEDGSRLLYADALKRSGLKTSSARGALAILCAERRAVVEPDGRGYSWARRGLACSKTKAGDSNGDHS